MAPSRKKNLLEEKIRKYFSLYFLLIKQRNRFEQKRCMCQQGESTLHASQNMAIDKAKKMLPYKEVINFHWLLLQTTDCSPNNSPAFLINDMHQFFVGCAHNAPIHNHVFHPFLLKITVSSQRLNFQIFVDAMSIRLPFLCVGFKIVVVLPPFFPFWVRLFFFANGSVIFM